MSKLLVVVDYQNDFVNGSLGFPKAVELEEKIYQKCVNSFEEGNKIVFTYDTHFEDYLETREGKNLPVEHCIHLTEGHGLFGKIQFFLEENHNSENIIQVLKASFGVELDRDYHKLFGGDDVTEIEIIGVVTNICVISNAVMFQAFFPEATITVDASLCASFNDELHEKSLDVMEGLQVKVINRERKDV